jgi:hypothetical protein
MLEKHCPLFGEQRARLGIHGVASSVLELSS